MCPHIEFSAKHLIPKGTSRFVTNWFQCTNCPARYARNLWEEDQFYYQRCTTWKENHKIESSQNMKAPEDSPMYKEPYRMTQEMLCRTVYYCTVCEVDLFGPYELAEHEHSPLHQNNKQIVDALNMHQDVVASIGHHLPGKEEVYRYYGEVPDPEAMTAAHLLMRQRWAQTRHPWGSQGFHQKGQSDQLIKWDQIPRVVPKHWNPHALEGLLKNGRFEDSQDQERKIQAQCTHPMELMLFHQNQACRWAKCGLCNQRVAACYSKGKHRDYNVHLLR